MDTNILPESETLKIDKFLSEIFVGTSLSERRVISVDLKIHTFLKMYARKRGWTLTMSIQHLIREGFEYEAKKEALKSLQAKKLV
jgi:macrodomain Ter protein organizer (MatP/YcbG family)